MTDMDRGARGWLIVVAADNFWRVASWYELSDLIQDGYVVWARVVKRYEVDAGRVRSRGHLMRLFKTAYLNHIHDLSKRRTRGIAEWLASDVLVRHAHVSRASAYFGQDIGDDVWDALGCSCDAAELAGFIAEAPETIRRVLLGLIASEGRALRSLYRVAADGTRDTLNGRLCRIAGIDEEVDLIGALRAYLKPAV